MIMNSLNPCFSGTYSQRYTAMEEALEVLVLILVLVEHTLREGLYSFQANTCRLNPCFSGTYSQSFVKKDETYMGIPVLILVLVEHTLRVCWSVFNQQGLCGLILVLVEHTLGDLNSKKMLKDFGLNPCFSGTYSRSVHAQAAVQTGIKS